MNDYGNGQRLVSRFRDRILSVDGVGWHVWDGKHWSAEAGEQEATKLAHRTAQGIWAEAAALLGYLEHAGEDARAVAGNEPALRKRAGALKAWAIDAGNSSRVRAMLAAALPYIRVRADQMNADPMKLTCQNCTLVFERPREKGGEPRITRKRHDPADRITLLAGADYDPAATCEEFRGFVEGILPKEEVRDFVQELFGYAATADISEQKLFLFTGEGANGKSTLIAIVSAVLGGAISARSYAMSTPIETFMVQGGPRKGGEATPDLARLPHRRLLTAGELEDGMRLSEGLVKRVTGGDVIPARGLYEKTIIEFRPTFKLVLFVNKLPIIRGQDHGIWRRVRIVPFEVIIPDDKKDVHLAERIIANESSGVLNWMLDGLKAWLRGGLSSPEAVKVATEEYRSESDPIGAFAREIMVRKKGATVSASKLYAVYLKWCRANAEEPRKQKTFGRRLRELHFEKERIGTYFYMDVELAQDDFGPAQRHGEEGEPGDDEHPPPHRSYDGPG
jgi:putative DNA primase/helicase